MSALLTAERISGSETELHFFNLIIGLNGYTVCSGVISAELNGRNIISKPLDVEEYMRIGIISRKGVVLSRYAREYIEALKAHCM